MSTVDSAQVGPIRDLPREQVLRAFALVREGKVIDLAVPRFRGMPLFPGHPAFEVHAFRTPRGLRVGGDRPWGPHNEIGLGYMSEVVSGSMHSGAHIGSPAPRKRSISRAAPSNNASSAPNCRTRSVDIRA